MLCNKQGNRDYRIKESSREGRDKSEISTFSSLFHASTNIWHRSMKMHKKERNKEIETIQGKTLKRIFKLPVSTAYTGILMETGIWPAEQRIQYPTLMLYHDKKKSK